MHTGSNRIEATQMSVLRQLVAKGTSTEFGRKYGLSAVDSYPMFSEQVPIQTYADIKPTVEKLKEGAINLLWPGGVNKFAVSAGTSGEGKHLPLTDERLKSDRNFMQAVVKSYLRQRPNIFKLAGSHLSMPGSVEQHGDVQIGEISGFTAINAPGLLRLFQVVDPATLTELSFHDKFNLLLDEAIEADLKVITAVPSWILTLFQRVLEKTGKKSIADVWPNLQLMVCGGVKLANYRPHLELLARGLSLDFIETYGASEGYIGFTDDLERDDLKMVTDNGIFFECIPDPLPNTDAASIQETVPLWEVQPGVPYGLLMTTNAGLWRYTLNDIIEFTSVDPLRFVVRGRVNDMLDDFGEALYVYEADETLHKVASATGKEIGTFAIAPVLEAEKAIPYHHWFVQFSEPVHSDTLDKISRRLDEKLREINRHYAIRRESEALGAPQITSVSQGEINEWMKNHGKANAQGKLPKILPKNTKSLLHGSE